MAKFITIMMMVATTVVAHPITRRMQYASINGIPRPSGYVYAVEKNPTPLVHVQHEPIEPYITSPRNQTVCRTIKVHSIYPDIVVKSNTNNHTLETGLFYTMSDIFSTYSSTPQIEIVQRDTTLDTYSMMDVFNMMTLEDYNNFDNFVHFTFGDCTTRTELTRNILDNSKYTKTVSYLNPNQNNAFDNVEFTNVVETDEKRSVIGCLDDVECIINWCNSGHDNNNETYIYYPSTLSCIYPKNTTTRPSKNVNLVFNVV
jgi:hypothetical protein